MIFISFKNSLVYWDFQIFVVFFILSTVSRFVGSDETEIIMTLWTSLHKLAIVIIETTQNPLNSKSSNCPASRSLINYFFNYVLPPKEGLVTKTLLFFNNPLDKKVLGAKVKLVLTF